MTQVRILLDALRCDAALIVQNAEHKRNETSITMGWGRPANVGGGDAGLQTNAFGGRDLGDRYEVAKTNLQQGWGSSAAAGSFGGTTTSAYGALEAPTPPATPLTSPHYSPMTGSRVRTPRPSVVAGFEGYVHPASGGRLGRTAGAVPGSGRTLGNIGARARDAHARICCSYCRKRLSKRLSRAAGGNVTRGSYNPLTVPRTPPQTRGASWGRPQSPFHNGPAGISETQRWAHTTIGGTTPRTSSSGYGIMPTDANGQKILKPNWFSWQN